MKASRYILGKASGVGPSGAGLGNSDNPSVSVPPRASTARSGQGTVKVIVWLDLSMPEHYDCPYELPNADIEPAHAGVQRLSLLSLLLPQ